MFVYTTLTLTLTCTSLRPEIKKKGSEADVGCVFKFDTEKKLRILAENVIYIYRIYSNSGHMQKALFTFNVLKLRI